MEPWKSYTSQMPKINHHGWCYICFFSKKAKQQWKLTFFPHKKWGCRFFFSFWGCNRSNRPTWVLQVWFLGICLSSGVWTLQKKAFCNQKPGSYEFQETRSTTSPPLDVVNQIQPSSRPPNSPNHIFCFQLEVLPETKRLVSPFLPRLPIQKLL